MGVASSIGVGHVVGYGVGAGVGVGAIRVASREAIIGSGVGVGSGVAVGTGVAVGQSVAVGQGVEVGCGAVGIATTCAWTVASMTASTAWVARIPASTVASMSGVGVDAGVGEDWPPVQATASNTPTADKVNAEIFI